MDVTQINDAQQTLTSSQSQPNGKRKRVESSRDAVVYPRKRAVAACRQCRVRKVKCNNSRPACGSCLASKSQCCYDDSQDHSAFDPASLLILDRLDQVLSRLNQLPDSLRVSTIPTADTHISPVDEPPQPLISPDQDSSYDHLRIPSSKTSPDAILQWPIFENRYPRNYMVDAVFMADMADDSDVEELNPAVKTRRSNSRLKGSGIDEDQILDLVQRFLDLVHIKNPVLDPDTIWSYARRVVEDGLKWDSPSCLVLIACALGCVAQPHTADLSPPKNLSSLQAQGDDIQKGERYYNLARRRFGLFERDVLASQCQFLAGVYLMYTQRPLSAWAEFHSASRSYHMYLQCQARRPSRCVDAAKASKRRQLEQRLYWSCYKSECELRAEIELPNSSLADFHYPDMYPSPPDVPSEAPHGEATFQSGLQRSSGGRRSLGSHRQHEQSWFYYLTEITLRRIVNRVLNILYSDDHQSWTDETVPYMIKAASEFEQQLDEWYQGLPALIQYNEDTIPDEELPYMVYSRVLDIKAWIYRPLLYYAIHSPPNARCRGLVLPYLDKAVSNCMRIVRCEPVTHRHHGTWYATRGCTGAMLSLLAVVRCGTIHVPPDWVSAVGASLLKLRYWEDEGPGVSRAIEVIEGIMSTLTDQT
ncbi:hypothetical protein BGZ61DRAFT_341832 [Ilyonectria robusta]|uniref:uncharacterized protein n=1 Tax=Ilyonectria robusta TaxID=1079257 RepID=UPI001E8CF3FF|nr:uncharacterized protein BGZ61DRAFT_341832 [Ilyonectria robusta]KAH8734252.1 hypothetical protein BGZ61DRAFT_341832 [Ilyonectria robusta]